MIENINLKIKAIYCKEINIYMVTYSLQSEI